jgi:hypothetical protein
MILGEGLRFEKRGLAMTAHYTHPTGDGKRRAIMALSRYNENPGQENVTIDIPA